MVRTDNLVKFYINGNFIQSAIQSEVAQYGTSPVAYIGAANNGTTNFNGQIDDLQIYKGALTAEQIQVLYNSNDGCFDASTIKVLSLQSLASNVLCKGQNVSIPFGSANTSNPIKVQLSDANGSFSSPIEIGSGSTSPISAQIPINQPLGTNYKIRLVSSDSSPIISNVISNISVNAPVTATITGDATINEGEATNLTINFTGSAPYTYTITGGTSQTTSSSPLSISVSPLVNTSYSITSLSNTCGNGTGSGTATITINPVPIRLVSCFPFNGNANDSKGLNNSAVSGATLTTDRYGNANSAYSFGVNDKIETQVNTFNYQNFSISIWLNLYSVPQNPPYTYSLIKLNTFEILMSNSLYNNNSRAYSFMFRGLFSNIPTQILDNARWYNVVITKNENNYNFFINGQLISSFIDNVNTIDFGNFQTSFGKTTYQGWEYPFQGKIDDVQIYKGALTAGQVQALYNNTNACFDATTYTCLSNMTYNSILNGQQTLQVSNQIIGSSTIQTGSNIHFDSKNSVILQPGFKTETNTVFRASAGGGCN